MADRTVAVRLLARVDSYKRDMVGAAATTRKFGTDSVSATKSVSNELAKVKVGSTIVGTALLAMAGAAVVATAQFDKQMSNVAAVTGATADEMDNLRAAAIKAGQATVFSASEAAQAEAELAKAGIKTSDILGGALTGSLSLAAAGQLDLAEAATISAQAMNTFGLEGKDVGHIADVLAAGANKSAADVSQLGDALRQGGLVADQTGLSLEDTVATLSAFADRALIGSDAGTSLKSMLQRLTPQSQQAADKMEELGISAYDSAGNFVGLATFAENLKTSLSKLTPEARSAALGIIFGSDAVRGATVLYDLGAKGVQDYTAAVNDTGAASRMAATQLDNLAGDWEQLSGSIETTFIQSGSNANSLLRDTVQAATGAVNIIGQLPAPILATAGAVVVMGGAFLVAAPRVVAMNAALAASPALAAAATRAMAFTGVLVGVEALALLATSTMNARNEVEDLDKQVGILFENLDRRASKNNIDELWNQIAALQDKLDNPGFGETLSRGVDAINNSFANLVGGMGATESGYDKQLALLEELQGKYEEYRGTVKLVAETLGVDVVRAQELLDASNVGLTGDIVDTAAAVVDYAAAASSGSSASHKAAGSLDVLADSTATVEDRLKALQEQWDATIGGMLGVSDATIAVEKALDDVTDSVKENGNEWRLTTAAGRANQSAVNDSIQSFEDLREKLIETGQATEEQANKKMVGYLRTLQNSLPKTATGARAQIQSIIDKYNEIPPKKSTTVEIKDTGYATTLAHMNAIYAKALLLSRGVNLTITSSGDINAHGHNNGKKLAAGGLVDGPGTATSDSVAIRASRGEYVVNAAATSRNLAALDAMNFGGAVAPRAAMGGSTIYQVTVQAGHGFVVGTEAEVARQLFRLLESGSGGAGLRLSTRTRG